MVQLDSWLEKMLYTIVADQRLKTKKYKGFLIEKWISNHPASIIGCVQLHWLSWWLLAQAWSSGKSCCCWQGGSSYEKHVANLGTLVTEEDNTQSQCWRIVWTGNWVAAEKMSCCPDERCCCYCKMYNLPAHTPQCCKSCNCCFWLLHCCLTVTKWWKLLSVATTASA